MEQMSARWGGTSNPGEVSAKCAHCNIAVSYFDAKKSARCSQVLVVTELVVGGNQCSSLRTSFNFKKFLSEALHEQQLESSFTSLPRQQMHHLGQSLYLQTVFTKNVSSNNQAFMEWRGEGNITRQGNIFSHVCPQEGNHVVAFVHTYLLGDLTPPTHMGTSTPPPTCSSLLTM